MRIAMSMLLLLPAVLGAAEKPVYIPTSIQLSTRFGMGHACPISPTIALTASHVMDPKPYDKDVPLASGWWSYQGRSGKFSPEFIFTDRDIGVISGEFPVAYSIATEVPALGDRVYISAFDWRKASKSIAPRLYSLKVQYRSGLMMSFSEDTDSGSSGACVFNTNGEVVGIVAWGLPSGDEARAGVMVLVAGETLETFLPPKKEKPDE